MPPLTLHDRSPEHAGYLFRIERGRHDQDSQIVAQSALGFHRQRQSQIRIQPTLVEFVKDHRADACQFRVGKDAPREQAIRNHLHPRRRRHFPVHPCRQADRLAELLSKRICHLLRRHARRNAPWLQHDDLAFNDGGFAEQARQRQGHARRLACAGRRREHKPRMVAQARADFGQHIINRQGGQGRLHPA